MTQYNSRLEREFYESDRIVSVTSHECEFTVGDIVSFTNEAGVTFEPYKVLGFAKPEEEFNNRFIYIDDEAPWFPVKLDQLKKYKPEGEIEWAEINCGC